MSEKDIKHAEVLKDMLSRVHLDSISMRRIGVIQPGINNRDQMMLEMFRSKMVDQLTKEGIEAIRPNIEKAAIAVVREMEVHINAEYAERSRELIVRLALGVK